MRVGSLAERLQPSIVATDQARTTFRSLIVTPSLSVNNEPVMLCSECVATSVLNNCEVGLK